MNQAYEVNYRALALPSTPNASAVIFHRATAAMVDSRYVRTAGVPMYFTRQAGGFSVSCRSRRALENLPQTYGSVMGHFGELERGAVNAIPAAENFQTVYTLAPAFRSYATSTRRRLAWEVGGRLAEYLARRQFVVRVRVTEDSDSIAVSGAVADDLAALPVRFNGVFERQTVQQLAAA